MFSGTTGTKNFPNATATQICDAEAMYATLTGRVTGLGGTLYLNENSLDYQFMGPTSALPHARDGLVCVGRVAPEAESDADLRLALGYAIPLRGAEQCLVVCDAREVWGPSGVNSRSSQAPRAESLPQ